MSSFVAWRGWSLSKKRFADERSLEAEAELDEIWIHIAVESGSTEIATRVVDNIAERFWLLARSPFIGRRRDEDLRPGPRSFPVGEWCG